MMGVLSKTTGDDSLTGRRWVTIFPSTVNAQGVEFGVVDPVRLSHNRRAGLGPVFPRTTVRRPVEQSDLLNLAVTGQRAESLRVNFTFFH